MFYIRCFYLYRYIDINKMKFKQDIIPIFSPLCLELPTINNNIINLYLIM